MGQMGHPSVNLEIGSGMAQSDHTSGRRSGMMITIMTKDLNAEIAFDSFAPAQSGSTHRFGICLARHLKA
jgi:hypothetical protein